MGIEVGVQSLLKLTSFGIMKHENEIKLPGKSNTRNGEKKFFYKQTSKEIKTRELKGLGLCYGQWRVFKGC